MPISTSLNSMESLAAPSDPTATIETPRRTFATILLDDYRVEPQALEKAENYRERFGGRLSNVLGILGLVDEETIAAAVADSLGLASLSLETAGELELEQDRGALTGGLNAGFLEQRKWLPFRWSNGALEFAAADPLDLEVNQYLQRERVVYRVYVATETTIRELGRKLAAADQTTNGEAELTEHELENLQDLASEAPIVNLVNSLFTRAVQRKASDLHIEPYQGMGRVRIRVDGVLHDLEYLPHRLTLPAVSRIKILAGMDIAEKRRPQDGKIDTEILNKSLDIRVSTLPVRYGESLVLRFLLKESIRFELEALGIAADIQALIEDDLRHTSGVILLTGPTGSGKTTSLYSFLNRLNKPGVKIVTLEDPVEYELPGVNQIQVQSDIGYDFARGLRSVVRQDPDIVMVGEIRDQETARIAMQSSLTGHLVFSTVHTNDAPSAFTRLLDLGTEEYLLNAAIVAIAAQRLVRKVCSACAQPVPHADSLIRAHGLEQIAREAGCALHLRQGAGCAQCNHTGYRGRIAIVEYLRCDDVVKQQPKGADFIGQAKKHMAAIGQRSLYEDGLHKVVQGLTTVDEVIRVAG